VTNLISEALPRQVEPTDINAELELLQETLSKLVDKYSLVSRAVTVILPTTCASIQTHSVPFDLKKSADLKEFLISLPDKEFWQEFDTDAQDCRSPIFGAHYLGPGEEQGTSHVLTSWANQELLNRYIDLCLFAKLRPTLLVPELQSILNVLYPVLERKEREGDFAVLHLARGRNKLIAVSPERICVAHVNISDLDEELFEQAESVDVVTGDFWDEVGTRSGSALKQAYLYLREQEGVPPIKNIYVFSEAPQIQNMLSLFKKHFDLGILRNANLSTLFAQKQFQFSSALSTIQNHSAWASVLGGGLQVLTPSDRVFSSQLAPRFQINLHPQRDQIYKNWHYTRLIHATNFFSISILLLACAWVGIWFAPQYFHYENLQTASQTELKAYQDKQNTVYQLNTQISQLRSQIQKLNQADQVRSQTRFVLTLPTLLPNGVELNALQISDKSISIRGQATSSANAQNLMAGVSNAKLLNAPTIAMSKPEDGRISFVIEGKPGLVN
jgi:Tfp pilus assembly protein PilN